MSRWSLAATWLVVLPLIALNLRAEDKPSAAAQNSGSDQTAIEKALAEKTKVEFIEVPLSDAVEVLAKKHAIQIVIDREALEKVGIGSDSPVTARLSGVSLRAALDRVLRDFGIAWTVRDGALLITTQEVAENILSTKVYPVEDIVAGRDEYGKPADGSKALVDLVNRLFDLNGNRRIEGASVHVVDAKGDRALSITHNRWVHEDVADLPAAMRSALRRDEPAKRKPSGKDKIKAALKEQTFVDFVETPLQDVIDVLANKHKIEIQINVRALRNVGIGTDTPATRHLDGISLQSALSIILREPGLTYIIQGKVLLITTPEIAELACVTRAYDVADLLTSHDESGKVHLAKESLLEAIAPHVDRHSYFSPSPGAAAWFSNGGVHLFVAHLDYGRQDAIDWLLKEIRRIGRRESVELRPPTDADEKKPKQPRILSTVLPGEEAIQKALARKVSLDFNETSLWDVIDFLKDTLKIEIQLDVRALGNYEIGGDIPVTAKASDITLRDTLKKVLAPLNLTWTIRDEVLLITTFEDAEEFLVTKVYAVADLPDSLLPLKLNPHGGSRVVISSDTVRALVVVEPYSVQEQIAAKLVAARKKKQK